MNFNKRASFLLLTFNQASFVVDSFESILRQDSDEIEIIVSDDCSTDATWDLINQVYINYHGEKSIILNRNSSNLGIVGNYMSAFNLSSGDVIFTAAGDDISLPTRCSDSLSFWFSHNERPDLIASDGYDMQLNGVILGNKFTDELKDWDLQKWVCKRPFIFGASHMLTRRLLSANTLNANLPYEDQCLLFRALLMGGAVRLPKILIMHRRGGISQQPNNYNYLIKKESLIKSSIDSISESTQMSSDALLLGCSEFVKIYLATNIRNAEYALSVLHANDFAEKVKLLISTKNVLLQKRIRYFQFSAFPFFHKILLLLKKLFLKSIINN